MKGRSQHGTYNCAGISCRKDYCSELRENTFSVVSEGQRKSKKKQNPNWLNQMVDSIS